jgi:flagellar biosynthetic protein FliR
VDVWLAMFARIVPIVGLSPLFGGRALPRPLVPIIAAALTTAVRTIRPNERPPTGLVASVTLQLAIGTTIALISAFVVGTIEAAGRLADDSRGASSAQQYVPQLEAFSSPLAQLDASFAIAVFWASGLHVALLRAIFATFDSLPIDDPRPGAIGRSALLMFMTSVAGELVSAGLALAAPAVASSLLLDVALGLVSRASPQVNAFFLGLPLKLAAVVAVTAASLPGRSETWFHLWIRQISWLTTLFGA